MLLHARLIRLDEPPANVLLALLPPGGRSRRRSPGRHRSAEAAELDLLDGHLEARLAARELLVGVVRGKGQPHLEWPRAGARAPSRPSSKPGIRLPAPSSTSWSRPSPPANGSSARSSASCAPSPDRRRPERADVVDHDEVPQRRGALDGLQAREALADALHLALDLLVVGARLTAPHPRASAVAVELAVGSTPISIENSRRCPPQGDPSGRSAGRRPALSPPSRSPRHTSRTASLELPARAPPRARSAGLRERARGHLAAPVLPPGASLATELSARLAPTVARPLPAAPPPAGAHVHSPSSATVVFRAAVTWTPRYRAAA